MFSEVPDDPTIFRREGPDVAFRFPDPLGRRDAARRLIPHEFIVHGDQAEMIGSTGDGVALVWPSVAAAYAEVWELGSPPSKGDLRLKA